MNTNLRRGHFIIWIILFILLPIVMFFAVQHLNFSNRQNAAKTMLTTDNVYSSAENKLIKVVVLRDGDAFELQVELIKPLKSASALLYNVEANAVIGQLQGVGVYRYKLNKPLKTLQIKDPIEDRLLTELKL